jgi:hypothetical protein
MADDIVEDQSVIEIPPWSISVLGSCYVTKKICSPLSLTLSSDYNVILLRIVHMGFLRMFYQNKLLMENYRFMTSYARCIFIGNSLLKNVAYLDSMIVPTCMSGTPEFIIKNLYPML